MRGTCNCLYLPSGKIFVCQDDDLDIQRDCFAFQGAFGEPKCIYANDNLCVNPFAQMAAVNKNWTERIVGRIGD